MDEQKPGYTVQFPKEFFDNVADFLKNGKRIAWLAALRSLAGLFISFFFIYLFFIGGQGSGTGSGRSPYWLSEEKFNAVAVPGESLKAKNVPETPVVPGTFVIVDISGVISEAEPSFQDKLYRLEAASKEPGVKAVILHINSPGGTVTGSEALREEVLRLKKNGIKVVALYDGIAASGACYMSVDADYIIATRSSMVGSIGVVFSWYNLKGLMDRYGVKMEVFKSGKFKDMGSFARDPSPEETKLLQNMINETFDRFVGIVMEGRHLSRAEVLKFANGSVFSPTTALGYKFIDQVSDSGKRDAVLKAMELTKVNNPKVLRVRRAPPSLLDLLSSKLNLPKQDVQEKIIDMVTETPTLRYEWRP